MRIFPFLEYFIYATGKNEKDFQVGIKLQEAQNYVPKDIQNKNKRSKVHETRFLPPNFRII